MSSGRGASSQLIGQLSGFFPKNYNRYFEPFLGGGAVYFYLKPKTAVIADANFELINVYRVVSSKVKSLIRELKRYQSRTLTEEYYYEVRRIIPDSLSDVDRAARFIFLNKICYNGLYRVNKDGEFNVPFGKYERMPQLFNPSNLRAASALLKSATIRAEYCLPLLEEFQPGEGDFVYLDPPYASETSNGFTSYTKEVFSWSEQEKLAREFAKMSKRGCQVMVSNINEKAIEDLYRESARAIIPVKADRMINSKGNQRTGHSELVILSYIPERQTLEGLVRER